MSYIAKHTDAYIQRVRRAEYRDGFIGGVITAFTVFVVLIALSYTAHAGSLAGASNSNCVITMCVGGGDPYGCWPRQQRQLRNARQAGCKAVQLKTGYSAYAMVTSLPGVCIPAGASIYVHRVYNPRNYKAYPVGSPAHNYYFGRIHRKTLAYFIRHGGMRKEGIMNAVFLTRVPANETGVPLCK